MFALAHVQDLQNENGFANHFMAREDQISLPRLLKKKRDHKPPKIFSQLKTKANMDESTLSKASEEQCTKQSAVE